MSGGKISPAMMNAIGRVQGRVPAPMPAQPAPFQAQALDPRNNAWAQMKTGLLAQQGGQQPMPTFMPGGKIPPQAVLGQPVGGGQMWAGGSPDWLRNNPGQGMGQPMPSWLPQRSALGFPMQMPPPAAQQQAPAQPMKGGGGGGGRTRYRYRER